MLMRQEEILGRIKQMEAALKGMQKDQKGMQKDLALLRLRSDCAQVSMIVSFVRALSLSHG